MKREMNAEDRSTGDDSEEEVVQMVPPKRRMRVAPSKPPVDYAAEMSTSEEESDECSASDESSPTDESSADENDSIYLDYNATTPLDREVLATINRVLRNAWGNPSSSHDAGVKAKAVIKESREQVAKMIGASSEEIIFTSGGTESNNLVLHSAVEYFWASRGKVTSDAPVMGDSVRPHIIASNLEHDSIKLVLEHFQRQGKVEVTFVPASSGTGRVETSDLTAAIQPLTCLVTVMLANNETGIIQPVPEIGACLSAINKGRAISGLPEILFHTDAAQAIGKIPVDVGRLSVDYLTIVGHKFYGPRIGALYVRQLGSDTGAPLHPLFFGGGQERNYRPGTENTGMIAGLGKACELVVRNIERYEQHMRTVRDHLEKQLELTFPGGIHINGKLNGSERIPNTCNVSILGHGFEGHKVLSCAKKVQASLGAACHSDAVSRASPILLSIGIPEDIAINAIRLSIGRLSTLQEMENVVKDLKYAIDSIISSQTVVSTNCP